MADKLLIRDSTTGRSKEADITSVYTSSTDTSKRLAPKGDGGVEWSTAGAGGDGGKLVTDYKAPSGVTISSGNVVYKNSTNDEVNKAQANALATMWAIGIATETFADGATGEVSTAGIVTGIGSSWTAGGKVYLSPTAAGGMTQTRPTTVGQYIVCLGTAKNATDLQMRIEVPIYIGI